MSSYDPSKSLHMLKHLLKFYQVSHACFDMFTTKDWIPCLMLCIRITWKKCKMTLPHQVKYTKSPQYFGMLRLYSQNYVGKPNCQNVTKGSNLFTIVPLGPIYKTRRNNTIHSWGNLLVFFLNFFVEYNRGSQGKSGILEINWSLWLITQTWRGFCVVSQYT